jgi:hypothetical protein
VARHPIRQLSSGSHIINFYFIKSVIDETFYTAFVGVFSVSDIISVVAIRMHPNKCSSVRSVLVLDMTSFGMLNSFSYLWYCHILTALTKCVF